jgi:SAM-dependent methyltransferase
MSFEWSVRNKAVREIRALLPPINKLPVVPRARDTLADELSEGASLLDIGASDRRLNDFLKRSNKSFSYMSMDIDESLPHDYTSLEEINDKFDVIVCFEVIEHLLTEDVLDLLSRVYELLNEGGALYLSTPNVFHPTAFWRDSTHRSGFRYSELAGYLASVGFREMKIYRVGRQKFLNRIRAIISSPVLRLLQMDYYSRILVKAYKKEGKYYAG